MHTGDNARGLNLYLITNEHAFIKVCCQNQQQIRIHLNIKLAMVDARQYILSSFSID